MYICVEKKSSFKNQYTELLSSVKSYVYKFTTYKLLNFNYYLRLRVLKKETDSEAK